MRLHILPLAQLLSNFAWSFVLVTLPFYIQEISPHDAATTLRWTGWILGITGLVTMLSSTMWGWLASHTSPKRLYVGAVTAQSVAFVAMAWAFTLPELFLIRLCLGVVGGASTLGFIIVGSTRDGDVRRQISAFQSAMTAGQVLGPFAGAVTAARIGFGWSFILAGLLLCATAWIVAWGVPSTGAVPPPPAAATAPWPEILAISLLSLTASAQVVFLPAILPDVLAGFGVEEPRRLEVGGLLVLASGAAAAVGSLASPRVADLLGPRAAVGGMVYGSAAALVLMALAPGVWSFGALRVVQVLCVAPLFPLLFAHIARRVQGQVLGLVNSARIGASFVGAIVATTLLAHATLPVVYSVLALASLPWAPLVVRHLGRGRAAGSAGA